MYRLPEVFVEAVREAQDRAEKVFRAVIGLVVENVDPLKLGRVRVAFQDLPGSDKSFWAPVASIGAGKQRGWFFLPEIDDEVVVMFEHGDIRRPIVIGAVHNGVDLPPEANEGGNERRVFHSRGNSRLELDDDKGTVVIHDGAGIATITIRDSNVIEIVSTADVCVQAPDGDLNAVAKSIEIKADQTLRIHAKAPMKVGADTIEYRGQSVGLLGKPTRFNPGGVPSPTPAQASCAEVADPIGEGGGPGGPAGAGGPGGPAGAGGPGGPAGAGGPAGGPAGAGGAPGGAPASALEGAAKTPEAVAPQSRQLGSLIDRGVKAAVRGVLKGTFKGTLPGLPMPASGPEPAATSAEQAVLNDAAKAAVKNAVNARMSGGDVREAVKGGAINSAINALPGLLRSSRKSGPDPDDGTDD